MHPSREELAGLALGTIPEEQAERIADHVEGCPQCEQTLRELETAADEVVHTLRQPALEHPFERESPCRQLIDVVNAIGREPSAAAHRPAPEAGKQELGTIRDYRLLEKLGEGGMGAVYKAVHTQLDKVVALKILPSDRLKDSHAVRRFQREMKAVGGLSHPNIVGAHDAGEHEGTHFLVMEYVDGVDLSELVRRLGPLSIADACELVRQAAVGLQYVDEHGLVHRDVKPSNLMLTAEGRVKILDLGLALLDNGGRGESTTTGRVMGTIDYMAPEQADDSHDVDIRADVFSLGATLFKLLCGQPPLGDPQRRTVLNKLNALANEPIPSIGELRQGVPPDLAAVVARMLAKAPAERYGNPAEVVQAIRPFTTGCDLAALARAASVEPERSGSEPVPTRSTRDGLTSPHAGTRTSRSAELPAVPARTEPRRRKPWKVAVGLVALGGVVVLTAAIIITITRHGRQTEVQVPEGSKVGIGEDANLHVTLPDESPTPAPTITPQQLHAAIRAHNPAYNGKGRFVLKRGQIVDVGLSNCGISDLSPLAGLPLVELRCIGNTIADLAPLEGMPLGVLDFGGNLVSDLAPLEGMRLTRLNCYTNRIRDLAPLAGMPLVLLHCGSNRIESLEPLEGMPLAWLTCDNNRITDLGPLAELPLTHLNVACNRIRDLSPIENLRLAHLECGKTDVVDLSPCRGMPLVELGLNDLAIGDLTVLCELPLERLVLSPDKLSADVSVLRDHRTLNQIGVDRWLVGKTPMPSAEEFWKRDAEGNQR